MANLYLLISSLVLIISVSVLALSTYGLGREEHNKLSSSYQSAQAFTGIGAIGFVISLIVLMFTMLRSKSLVQTAQSVTPYY